MGYDKPIEKIPLDKGKAYFEGYSYVDDFKALEQVFKALWETTREMANRIERDYAGSVHQILYTAAVRDVLKAAKLAL